VFVFTWLFLPETRDRTLEEINEMFDAGVPARKFKGYNCTGTAAMAAAVLKEKRTSAAEHEEADKESNVARND